MHVESCWLPPSGLLMCRYWCALIDSRVHSGFSARVTLLFGLSACVTVSISHLVACVTSCSLMPAFVRVSLAALCRQLLLQTSFHFSPRVQVAVPAVSSQRIFSVSCPVVCLQLSCVVSYWLFQCISLLFAVPAGSASLCRDMQSSSQLWFQAAHSSVSPYSMVSFIQLAVNAMQSCFIAVVVSASIFQCQFLKFPSVVSSSCSQFEVHGSLLYSTSRHVDTIKVSSVPGVTRQAQKSQVSLPPLLCVRLRLQAYMRVRCLLSCFHQHVSG